MRDNSRARNPDTHRRLGARQGRPSRHVYLSRVRVHLGHDPSASLPFLFHLPPLIEFSEKILSCTDGMDQATFVADALTYDASLRNLELVGEAATHVPSARSVNGTRKSLGARSSAHETGWLMAI